MSARCCDGGPNGCPTCRPILWRPTTRVEFTLASGEVVAREWMMFDRQPAIEDIPAWLDNPRKAWPHPQDPVTFKGDVRAGHEDECMAFVAGGREPAREGSDDGDR